MSLPPADGRKTLEPDVCQMRQPGTARGGLLSAMRQSDWGDAERADHPAGRADDVAHRGQPSCRRGNHCHAAEGARGANRQPLVLRHVARQPFAAPADALWRWPVPGRPANLAALHDPETAWHRRHGRRVSGLRSRARRRRGDQGDSPVGAIGRDRGEGARNALQARAGAGPPGHAQVRRPHSRSRRDRRHQVLDDAVCRRRDAGASPS